MLHVFHYVIFFYINEYKSKYKASAIFSASLSSIPSLDMTLMVSKRKKKGKITTDMSKEGRAILHQGERKHRAWSWQEHPKVQMEITMTLRPRL